MKRTIQRNRKLLTLVLLSVLFLSLLTGCGKSGKYDKANALYQTGSYSEAAKIFMQLQGYEDADEMYLWCRYQIADRYYQNEDYLSAASNFEGLGSFADSADRLLGCHYALGQQYASQDDLYSAAECFQMAGDYADSADQLRRCRYELALTELEQHQYHSARELFAQAGDWADSREMILEAYYQEGEYYLQRENYWEAERAFTQAGDYKDAPQRIQESAYWNGHDLFMAGDYKGAQAYLDRVTQYPEGEGPHFLSLKDAKDYLESQKEQLNTSIVCYVAYMEEEQYQNLNRTLNQLLSYQRGNVYYSQSRKKLTVDCAYYSGERILHAWRTGDDSGLSDAERKAMKEALAVVKKAKSNTKSDFSRELYLLNWISSHVKYESPDMEVPTQAYLQLRQLSCVGALLDGKANCQGYTDTFYLLANMAGFEVNRFFGLGDDEGHCWNNILLDDKLYFVDATFCDTDSKIDRMYPWFNCSYDQQVYEIEGGTSCFPNLVMEDDLSQTYYEKKDAIFGSRNEAANYLAKQCKKNGKGTYHAMVEDAELSNSKILESLKRSRTKVGINNGFSYTYVTYAGNTYISVKWT